MTNKPARRQHRYSELEIERGLIQIALCSGNTRRAADELKELGFPVPRTTLKTWAETRSDLYERILEERLTESRKRMAAQFELQAAIQTELAEKVAAELDGKVSQLKPGEAASALRNVTTSAAINVDKAQLLRGLPTQISQQQSAEELYARLASLSQVVVDAEVVEEG